MGIFKGGFQRLFQTALYFLLFIASGVILGVYSYFLAVLADHHQHIPTYEKAVEGISGAACLYLIFAVLLTCCLGGVSFFAFFALVLDLLFFAGMIGIAVMTRHGADSCKGNVQTPLGNGNAQTDRGFGKGGFGFGNDGNVTYEPHLGLACKLNTAAFACSIIAAFLFLCTAVMQVLLVRHHKKEKRYGPGPDNNYTSGYGSKKSRFGFGRKNKGTTKDAEANALPAHPEPSQVGTNGTASYGSYNRYSGAPETTTHTGAGHTGYYTAPTGTAASNPYGYNNTGTNY